MTKLYILKVRSSTKIPHFVQIRNAQFELIDYLRLDRPFTDLTKYGLRDSVQQHAFIAFIKRSPFGRVKQWPPSN